MLYPRNICRLYIHMRGVFACGKGIRSSGIGSRKEAFQGSSDTENTQGMIAVADKGSWDRESFAETALKKGVNLVILDRLQDPEIRGP